MITKQLEEIFRDRNRRKVLLAAGAMFILGIAICKALPNFRLSSLLELVLCMTPLAVISCEIHVGEPKRRPGLAGLFVFNGLQAMLWTVEGPSWFGMVALVAIVNNAAIFYSEVRASAVQSMNGESVVG